MPQLIRQTSQHAENTEVLILFLNHSLWQTKNRKVQQCQTESSWSAHSDQEIKGKREINTLATHPSTSVLQHSLNDFKKCTGGWFPCNYKPDWADRHNKCKERLFPISWHSLKQCRMVGWSQRWWHFQLLQSNRQSKPKLKPMCGCCLLSGGPNVLAHIMKPQQGLCSVFHLFPTAKEFWITFNC